MILTVVVAARPPWSIAPSFMVDDVVATTNYYRDKRGFGYDRVWNETPSCCMVRRNSVVIMLAQLEQPGVMRPIDKADVLNAEFQSKDVKITRDVCDQPYGCRDLGVEDGNGYRLCCGHDTEGLRPDVPQRSPR